MSRDVTAFTDGELRIALAAPDGRKRLQAALESLRAQDRRHAEMLRKRHDAVMKALQKQREIAEARGTLIRRLEAALGELQA